MTAIFYLHFVEVRAQSRRLTHAHGYLHLRKRLRSSVSSSLKYRADSARRVEGQLGAEYVYLRCNSSAQAIST